MIHQKELLMLIFSILLKKHMYLPGRLVDTPQNLVSSLNLPGRFVDPPQNLVSSLNQPGRLVDHPLHCSGGSSKIQVDKVDPGKKTNVLSQSTR